MAIGRINRCETGMLIQPLRILLFVVFVANCAIFIMLLMSLTTDALIRSSPIRLNTTNSMGELNLGFFSGLKRLNVGYGWRSQKLNVFSLMRHERGYMSIFMWAITLIMVGMALVSTLISSITIIIQAASSVSRKKLIMIILLSNFIAGTGLLIAIFSWYSQFLRYLQYNVLPMEDSENMWSSNGQTRLAECFYYITASSVMGLFICIPLLYALQCRRKEGVVTEVNPEKNGNIMLF